MSQENEQGKRNPLESAKKWFQDRYFEQGRWIELVLILFVVSLIPDFIWDNATRWLRTASLNVMTGIVAGAVFYYLARGGEKRRWVEMLRTASNPPQAQFAVWNLRGEKWDSDGTLRNIKFGSVDLTGLFMEWMDFHCCDLSEAHLQGARLGRANLSNTTLRYLQGAHLRGANLSQANLSDAELMRANLRDTDLTGAVLRGANLEGANLEGANLVGVKLEGADLRNAILKDANLAKATLDNATQLNQATILPNGQQWRPGLDLEMFTNPVHQDFFPVEFRECEIKAPDS